MAETSHALNRRIGMLVDRAGRIEAVAVGDARRVEVPRKPSAPSGRDRFCTLRWLATRLGDEPLTSWDLVPLALHRLDALAVVGVGEDGAPGPVRVAHLLPADERDGNPAPAPRQARSLPPGAATPGRSVRGTGRGRREIEDVVADGARYRLFPPRPPSLVDDDFMALIGSLEEEFERRRTRTKISGKGGRAILVHVTRGSRVAAEESMAELDELSTSAGLGVVDRIVQRRQHFDPRTLMGSGRLEDLIVRASRLQADFIVVDQNLSPAQAHAIAESTAIKVIDRSQLILDIFARRARTHEGKIQVELAQLKYLLPRLMSRGDSGLSRLEGGIGGRGPGEQKLEVDRRRVRDRIQSLEKMLAAERTRREQRRSRRRERDVPVVSLVGYTNAGKSTLLNILTKSEVFVEHRMFATLDPSSRRLRLPREREIVINDTVGFIRDLPKDLLAAFRATLEEIEGSDLLVHLVDMSHPRYEAQIAAVEGILKDLGVDEIPRLVVFNKADLLDEDRRTELASARPDALVISAVKREGIRALLNALDASLASSRPFHAAAP
ncbi:MAG TPA: GTPase HflX [Candidatus Sulfotelmatobacter sp.]|jgi:GTP-binding protein HflX|nr:GTPase HflX [Candidatus Sulfotelmatobacter sp.]